MLHINGNTQYVALSGLASFINIAFLSFTHVIACVNMPFHLPMTKYSIVWIYHILFNQLMDIWVVSTVVWLFFLKFYIIVDLQCCVSFRCTAKLFSYTYTYIFGSWIMLQWRCALQFSCGCYVFNSFGYIPKSGIFGSYGNSTFNFLRYHQTVFHSSCTILHCGGCNLDWLFL